MKAMRLHRTMDLSREDKPLKRCMRSLIQLRFGRLWLLQNLRPNGRLVINAIRKEDFDKDYLQNLSYHDHLWMEREIKSVANVTSDDVNTFLNLAAEAEIKPDIEEFDLKDANEAILELKKGKIRGAKVLNIN